MSLEVALALFEYVVLLLAISLHDAVQAWVAARLGDPTARMLGRQSMNPLKHWDLFGTIVFPIFYMVQSPLIFGWGKPVPVTERNFRRGSRDEMMVYLSGPVAHLFGAGVCLALLVLLKHVVPGAAGALPVALALAERVPGISTLDLPPIFPALLFLYYGILVNLLLLAFNVIPLPSLDGGKVLRHFLSYNAQRTYDSMGLYLMLAFFFLGFRVIFMILTPLLGVFNGLLFAL
ncbi:MAG TPA: site-2 protease family protein [Granulicella sp.]|nr:site-2 protease family protein [Granulicella sp.]